MTLCADESLNSTNHVVLHGWCKAELSDILAYLPEPCPLLEGAKWASWCETINGQVADFAHLPPLRMLLVMDNLAGHKTPEFVVWLF